MTLNYISGYTSRREALEQWFKKNNMNLPGYIIPFPLKSWDLNEKKFKIISGQEIYTKPIKFNKIINFDGDTLVYDEKDETHNICYNNIEGILYEHTIKTKEQKEYWVNIIENIKPETELRNIFSN